VRRACGYDAAALMLVRQDPLNSLSGQPSLLEGIRRVYGEPLTPSEVVERIVEDVRVRGDEAICFHTRAVSGITVPSLEVPKADIAVACERVDSALVDALRLAASRIRQFHEACAIQTGSRFVDAELGRRILPLRRVGLYVPGGKVLIPILSSDVRHPCEGGRCF
jgi:histidinol dehydrogenase